MPSKKALQAQKDFAFNMSLLMNIMKSVALSQFVQFKKSHHNRYAAFMDYFKIFFHIMDLTKNESPFVREMSPVVGVIVTASDATMLSGLNSKLLRAAFDEVGDQPCHFMVTGAKGTNRLKNEERSYQAFLTFTFKNMLETAIMVKNYVVKQVMEKKMGRVMVVYA